MNSIDIVPHHPHWHESFEAEAELVARILGDVAVAIHHVGSTAIPGIYAKPVIDMLVEFSDVNAVDAASPLMKDLGYEVMGEFGILGRRYFRKDNDRGVRTHQIHAFAAGSEQVVRHLAFRDYMIAHPGRAQAYSELKRKLAADHPESMNDYMDGKDAFIIETDRLAAKWRAMR